MATQRNPRNPEPQPPRRRGRPIIGRRVRFTLDFDVTHPAIPQALDYLANSQGLSRTAWLRQVAKVAFDAAVAAGEVPRAIAAAVPDDWLTADTVYLESPCAEPRKK